MCASSETDLDSRVHRYRRTTNQSFWSTSSSLKYRAPILCPTANWSPRWIMDLQQAWPAEDSKVGFSQAKYYLLCSRGLRRKKSQGAGEGPPATLNGWSHPCTTTWFDPMSSTWPEDSPALFGLKRPPGKRATPRLSFWGQVSTAAFTMCTTTGAVGKDPKEVGMHWWYWPLGVVPISGTRWL